MDEVMMYKWIDLVLIPWKESRNPGVIPVLILDAYRVHMIGSVVNRIQSLRIEVQHIPAGCTYLCQPVDVGINRPIKVEMTEQWEEWMVSGGGSQMVLRRRLRVRKWQNGLLVPTRLSRSRRDAMHGERQVTNGFKDKQHNSKLFVVALSF